MKITITYYREQVKLYMYLHRRFGIHECTGVTNDEQALQKALYSGGG
jgi:hypothetical protein